MNRKTDKQIAQQKFQDEVLVMALELATRKWKAEAAQWETAAHAETSADQRAACKQLRAGFIKQAAMADELACRIHEHYQL